MSLFISASHNMFGKRADKCWVPKCGKWPKLTANTELEFVWSSICCELLCSVLLWDTENTRSAELHCTFLFQYIVAFASSGILVLLWLNMQPYWNWIELEQYPIKKYIFVTCTVLSDLIRHLCFHLVYVGSTAEETWWDGKVQSACCGRQSRGPTLSYDPCR